MAPGIVEEHFRAHMLVTVARVMQEAAHSYESPEALVEAVPFLRDYIEELARRPAQLDLARWYETIAAVEAGTQAHLPLRSLRDAARLDRIAIGVLMTVGLVEEDPRFGLLFEPFQRVVGASRPTVGMLHEWWSPVEDRGEVRIAIRRLRELGLLEVTNPDAPRLDWSLQVPTIVWDAIRGELPSQPMPGVTFRAHASLARLEQLVVPDAISPQLPQLASMLRRERAPALVVRGARHTGASTLIEGLAASLGLGMVEVAGRLDDARWCQLGAVATMLDALVLVRTTESIELVRPPVLARPLAVVCRPEGSVTVDGGTVMLDLPVPDLRERTAHWSRVAPAIAPVVAERWRIGRGQIYRTAEIAAHRAELTGRTELDLGDVREALRAIGSSSIESLAPRVAAGEGWDRFVVAPETLEELRILERRCRYRERLHAPQVGVRALFKGPSGTGKTMAARVLATSLEKDLYRVDLAATVSKYIGETEKNLGRIFAIAEELDAMLLFDEGDALFGARTNVQSSNDRYANLETNYLLQRIEAFEGMLVITTNAADAIDGAFQRRMDAVLDFRAPQPAERFLLWQVHLPAEHAVPVTLVRELATRCALTGAQVRNVLLHASLLALDDARLVDAGHVEAAVFREYRKSGGICPLRQASAARA